MYKNQNAVFYEIQHINKQNLINLQDTKKYLRVSHDEDDIFIEQIIDSAIESCENYCGFKIISREIKITICNFYDDKVMLPLSPLKNIKEIKSSKGNQSFDISDYTLNKKDGVIIFDKIIRPKLLEIIFEVGFEDFNLIPKSLIQGIMMHISQIYDSGSYQNISKDLEKLYNPYRKIRI